MIPLRDTIPSRTLPIGTFLIAALNVFIFVQVAKLPVSRIEPLYLNLGLVPTRFHWALHTGSAPTIFANLITPITSMFLHGGLFHLIFNMWSLWIFGDNVEDKLGLLRYLFFYLICGVVAASVHLLVNPGSALPTVGASGAIAGVMGAYAVLFPSARIVTLIPVIIWPVFVRIPAIIFMGIWIVGQLLSGVDSLDAAHATSEVGGIAWWAHIGGFACGFTLGPWLVRSSSRRSLSQEPT